MPYRLTQEPVPASQLPDWTSVGVTKWKELTDLAEGLEPGTAIPVEFDDLAEAKRARNAVRDAVNLRHEKVVIRTKIEAIPGKQLWNMWIIRLKDGQAGEETK